MKKVVLFFAVAIAAVSANAQTNKGQWLVGGNAGFSSSKEGDYKQTNINFSPNAGYFFIPNLAGGLRLDISSEVDKFDADNKETYSAFTVAPFLRYYFLPIGEKVKLFGDASFGFGSNKYKVTEDGEEVFDESRGVTAFGISAGPAIFLSPNTALEFTINYNSRKLEDADDANSTFGVGIGLQIHLGGKK